MGPVTEIGTGRGAGEVIGVHWYERYWESCCHRLYCSLCPKKEAGRAWEKAKQGCMTGR